MEDFKKMVKMKAGGSVASALKEENKHCSGGKIGKYKEGGKVHEDEAQDKALIKKGLGKFAKAEDKDEKTELKLKSGGRAKKAQGSVKKYKAGGAIEMKKTAGDKDTIKKVKATGNKKADAPNAAVKRPAFRASDVDKEKGKPAGDAVKTIKVKPTGDKKAAAPNKASVKPNAKGVDAVDDLKGGGRPKYKKGGDVKKFADGGSSNAGGIATQSPIPPSIAAQLMQAAPGARLQGANPSTMGSNPLPVDNPVIGGGGKMGTTSNRPISYAQDYIQHHDPMSHLPQEQINRILMNPAIQNIINRFKDQ